MNPKSWTDSRLQKLFQHYNKKFWKRRLPYVAVKQMDIEDNIWGRYFPEDNHIEIYVSKMKNDRQVRSTLLHEMCHLAAGPKSIGKGNLGHDSAFYCQLEKLLKQKAPIDIATGENPSLSKAGIVSLQFNVPKRFKLCRAALAKFSKKREKEMMRARMDGNLDMIQYMLDEFEDSGRDLDCSWKEALIAVGSKVGMLDIDDKPLPWARRYLAEARKVFNDGRRIRLMVTKKI